MWRAFRGDRDVTNAAFFNKSIVLVENKRFPIVWRLSEGWVVLIVTCNKDHNGPMLGLNGCLCREKVPDEE